MQLKQFDLSTEHVSHPDEQLKHFGDSRKSSLQLNLSFNVKHVPLLEMHALQKEEL